jgi:hypothetical protein
MGSYRDGGIKTASVVHRTAVVRMAGALCVYVVSTEGKLLLRLQYVVVFGTNWSPCQCNLLPPFSDWSTLGIVVPGFSETLQNLLPDCIVPHPVSA